MTVAGLMAFERLDDFLRVFRRETKHFDEGTGARRLSLPLNDVLHYETWSATRDPSGDEAEGMS